MKVAFVHDWLDTYRGGEKVLEALVELFPNAPIYTLFYEPSSLPKSLTERTIIPVCRSSLLSRFRKLFFPWLPSMIESIDLRDYDLIVSSSSGFAKGVIPSPHAVHICYLHSPMRYVWDQQKEYEKGLLSCRVFRSLFRCLASRMRIWDVASLPRVDRFVVNSNFIKQRVRRYYSLDSKVIHPPVDVETLARKRIEYGVPTRDYWLVAGALVPYKRVDLAVSACEQSQQRLVVAGAGPEFRSLKKLAGSYTKFVNAPDQAEWERLLFHARGLIFPGVEDFGMVPIECMALGTPVLAFAGGGALDYIEPTKNGLFFSGQNLESLCEAMKNFTTQSFDSSAVSASVSNFGRERYITAMRQEISALLKAKEHVS